MIRTTKQHTILALALIVLVLVLFYRDIVFGGHTFLMLNSIAGTMPISDTNSAYGYKGTSFNRTYSPVRDLGAIAWTNEPSYRIAKNIVSEGELPLWSPYSGLGDSLMTDGNSGITDPMNLLVLLIPDQWWSLAIDIQVLLRFLLAGICTYLFIRRLNLSLLAGVTAASAYMLCSYFVAYGNHAQMRAETLLPLAIYVFDRMWERQSPRRMLITLLVICWIYIVSFPESGFLALFLAATWYIYRSLVSLRLDSGGYKLLVQRIIAFAVLVGTGLAAFFLLSPSGRVKTLVFRRRL